MRLLCKFGRHWNLQLRGLELPQNFVFVIHDILQCIVEAGVVEGSTKSLHDLVPGVQIRRHRVGQRVCIHIFFVGIEFSRKSLWQVPSGDPCLGCISQLLLHLFFYQVPLSLQFSHLISNISKSFYHDSRINHLGLKRIHYRAASLCKLRASLRSNSRNKGLHFLNKLHLISFVGLSHVLHFVVLDLLLVHNFHNHSSVFIKHLLLHYLRVG